MPKLYFCRDALLHTPIETLWENDGDDEQTRSLYSIDALREREKGTDILKLYNYWVASPAGKFGLPHMSCFYPGSPISKYFSEKISWIDTSSSDPFQFVMRDHRENPIPGWGKELSNKTLFERKDMEMHHSACAVECLLCKMERAPMYHEIEQTITGLSRHFTRLMVPVENDQGHVDRIYYISRRLRPIKRVSFEIVGQENHVRRR